ncbi:hypothetical protein Curi_c06480 [Gottschalkia acidurici 9a]|uniref:Uncharacterized protein n=1 Tax=Gottschalkia acidurici (strain ATCC 7906 / DSM 604 / BCRC 14475 / CIP 104303 / KCTC 5404 / NCIMB 10678 / 9a) TaxID=1128398 RepID=K0AZC1_GOTA9|nr:hypothetical protein [Gottschalkia acidurici]AFS77721.1 hypothetical protein Curi_c06480 [Gottschalkia acidurici 9a]
MAEPSCIRDSNGDKRLGWKVELTSPAPSATQSNTFSYRLTNIDDTNDLNSVEICLCSSLSLQELRDLLEDCSAIVTYDDGSTREAQCDVQSSQDIVDCSVGLRVRGIPAAGQRGQTQINITMTFTEPLQVSPVRVGIRGRGQGAPREEWEDICGPGCPVIPPPPPSRKIML